MRRLAEDGCRFTSQQEPWRPPVSVTPTALSSAKQALQTYSRLVDQAAARIASWGLENITDPGTASGPSAGPVPAGGSTASPDDLGEAMVTMMIAQRAFSAQLKVIRTSDEMIRDLVSLRSAGQG
jgi:hypothetical protein